MHASRIVRIALLLIVALMLPLAVAGTAEACPTCKDSLADGGAGENVARGFFWSILFMLSMPLFILGTFGTYVVVTLRRVDRPLPLRPAPRRTADPLGQAVPTQASGSTS